MNMDDLPRRVTVLETEMDAVQGTLTDIQVRLRNTATTDDVKELRDYLENRDKSHLSNMWKLVFILVTALLALVTAAFGLKGIPSL